MAELKQSRWVKVHEPGQANFEPKENIMDILIGAGRCQADVTFTVRSHKKAAYWLNRYLEAADATQLLHEIADFIEQAASSQEDVAIDKETWSCQIEKMAQGIFRVQLNWIPAEPVTVKENNAKTTGKGKKTRGRKKKAA